MVSRYGDHELVSPGRVLCSTIAQSQDLPAHDRGPVGGLIGGLIGGLVVSGEIWYCWVHDAPSCLEMTCYPILEEWQVCAVVPAEGPGQWDETTPYVETFSKVGAEWVPNVIGREARSASVGW